MELVLCSIAFITLLCYLLVLGIKYGIPNMVSDTFYQLQNDKKCGWIFSVVMTFVSFLTLVSIMEFGYGIQFLAFLGCAGLAFVGAAPNYCDTSEYKVHKIGATIAAIGCVGWSLSICWWITFIIAFLYGTYVIATDFIKAFKLKPNAKFHPWYWAEVSAFADIFATLYYGIFSH